MARRAGAQQVEILGRGEQRIALSACAASSLSIQHALAHAEGRDRDLLRLPEADDLLQQDRAVGEQRAARLGDALDVLQRLGIDLLHEMEEIETVAAGRSM